MCSTGLTKVYARAAEGDRRRLENVWKTRSKNKIRDIYWWRIIGAISTTNIAQTELSSYVMFDVASDAVVCGVRFSCYRPLPAAEAIASNSREHLDLRKLA